MIMEMRLGLNGVMVKGQMQEGIRPAVPVEVAASGNGETVVQVEPGGLIILFVDVNPCDAELTDRVAEQDPAHAATPGRGIYEEYLQHGVGHT